MLGTDAMMDTPDIAFHISDQGMNPGQDLGRFFPRIGDQPLMTERGRSIQEAVTLPTIGFDHRRGGQALLDQNLDLLAANSGYKAHGGQPGFISRRFPSYNHLVL